MKFSRLLLIFCTLVAVLTWSVISRDATKLKVDGEFAPTVVREVTVVEADSFPENHDATDQRAMRGGVGRSYARISERYLNFLSLPSKIGRGVRLKAKRDLYFNLWEGVEKIEPDSVNIPIIVSFEVRANTTKRIFLGIGGNDDMVVYQDGKAVWGCLGPRDSRLLHHIVALDLLSGTTVVSIVCRKSQPWHRIPSDQFQSEWTLNLHLFDSETAARKASTTTIFHPLDTPVVQSWDQFQVENVSDQIAVTKLIGIAGEEVAAGHVDGDGVIAWNTPPPAAPFCGIIEYAGAAEPIVVTGELSPEAAAYDLGLPSASDQEGPWTFRLRHLLKPEFTDRRDLWWARKYAMALAEHFSERSSGNSGLSLRCSAARIQFASYHSAIDGSTQYYRYFKASRASNQRPAVVVFLPTVPDPVRPFLETYTTADIKETESLAAIADTYGVDVLWAGGSCVDYGGLLSRTDTAESLNAYLKSENSAVFLLGNCSSGVTALGCVKSGMVVDGVVLWSPVVKRSYNRWLPRLGLDEPGYGDEVLSREQTAASDRSFENIPTFMLYDNNASGHGDRKTAAKFMTELKLISTQSSAVWIEPPEQDVVWGLRAVASIRTWMGWIRGQANQAIDESRETSRANIIVRLDPSATVKEALLKGFSIDENSLSNVRFRDYVAFWHEIMQTYRGNFLLSSQLPEHGGANVRFAEWTEELRSQLDEGKFFPRSSQSRRPLQKGAKVWGFRLLRNGQGVEIVSSSENVAYPRIDLMVDGACAGALWMEIDHKWILAEICP